MYVTGDICVLVCRTTQSKLQSFEYIEICWDAPMNSGFTLGQVTGDAVSMARLLGHSDELLSVQCPSDGRCSSCSSMYSLDCNSTCGLVCILPARPYPFERLLLIGMGFFQQSGSRLHDVGFFPPKVPLDQKNIIYLAAFECEVVIFGFLALSQGFESRYSGLKNLSQKN
jgi:hypothetical protein